MTSTTSATKTSKPLLPQWQREDDAALVAQARNLKISPENCPIVGLDGVKRRSIGTSSSTRNKDNGQSELRSIQNKNAIPRAWLGPNLQLMYYDQPAGEAYDDDEANEAAPRYISRQESHLQC